MGEKKNENSFVWQLHRIELRISEIEDRDSRSKNFQFLILLVSLADVVLIFFIFMNYFEV